MVEGSQNLIGQGARLLGQSGARKLRCGPDGNCCAPGEWYEATRCCFLGSPSHVYVPRDLIESVPAFPGPFVFKVFPEDDDCYNVSGQSPLLSELPPGAVVEAPDEIFVDCDECMPVPGGPCLSCDDYATCPPNYLVTIQGIAVDTPACCCACGVTIAIPVEFTTGFGGSCLWASPIVGSDFTCECGEGIEWSVETSITCVTSFEGTQWSVLVSVAGAIPESGGQPCQMHHRRLAACECPPEGNYPFWGFVLGSACGGYVSPGTVSVTLL